MTKISNLVRTLYRAQKIFFLKYAIGIETLLTKNKLSLSGAKFGRNLRSKGIPIIDLSLKGTFVIGDDFHIHNGNYNLIGRQQRCIFVATNNAILSIGNNVGISATAIICHNSITIEDNVRIGGNCVIYDTDFHDLDPSLRLARPENKTHVTTRPVIIKQNAFIGSHSTILKGVTIGENSIVGAGSVVTKNIPDNQIWGGNPAKFISDLNFKSIPLEKVLD